MKVSHLALVASLTLAGAGAAWSAEEPRAEAAAPAPEAAAPAAEAKAPAAEAPVEKQAEPTIGPKEMVLGPVGRDEHGHQGRVHTVVPGDTLWDVSDAYLGTPWVWPSLWQDNAAIQNPHRIYPGDKLWVSPYEMRKLTDAEAEALMAARGDVPAAIEEVDAMPSVQQGQIYRYTAIQTTGFISADDAKGAAGIVDSPTSRVWLSDHTEVEIGLGDGEAAVGDQFDIFRPGEKVTDPETGLVVGYATDELGWLEVIAVHEDTSTATIRMSRGEIMRGDHLLPRIARMPDIEVVSRPNVEGLVWYTPNKRSDMAGGDIVYLNRGTTHGLAVGSPLEVFRPMPDTMDTVQSELKRLPDHVVAKLLVVAAKDATAVAVVTHSKTEIGRGDRFRGTDSIAP